MSSQLGGGGDCGAPLERASGGPSKAAMSKVWGHSLIGSIDEAMLGPFAGSRRGVVVSIARATAGESRWELIGPVRQESASPLQRHFENHARALRQRPTFNGLSPRGRAGAEAESPPRSKRSSAPDCINDTISPLRPASSARVTERVLSLYSTRFVCFYRVASNATPCQHEDLPPRGK
ncbi:hypothetical protein Purlil1_2190 [Purpureocillium lilacinum]|uniref:Uncharacterized protein n=1 Tax=Purpureocillium lilacinum TaxID=33203 RepID=A0ABR0CD66_PURLI|nr:hypothetical protein Purlil1_2190 [Purpureocillium lilacinum]